MKWLRTWQLSVDIDSLPALSTAFITSLASPGCTRLAICAPLLTPGTSVCTQSLVMACSDLLDNKGTCICTVLQRAEQLACLPDRGAQLHLGDCLWQVQQQE